MLEEMFGEGRLMDPEELATEEVKKAREEALKEEKRVAEAAGEHDPSVSTKYVIVQVLPVPLEFRIDPNLCPGVNPIMVPSIKKPIKLQNSITNARSVTISRRIRCRCSPIPANA